MQFYNKIVAIDLLTEEFMIYATNNTLKKKSVQKIMILFIGSSINKLTAVQAYRCVSVVDRECRDGGGGLG